MNLKLALALFLPACLMAHDLYLMPDRFQVSPGDALTFTIHNGDDFPEAKSRVVLERLRNPALHARGGVPALPAFQMDGVRAVSTVQTARAAHLALTVETEARVEAMNAKDFLDYLKEEDLSQVIEAREKQGESEQAAKERYSKFAKTIVRVGDGDGSFNQPVGLTIEFVPEKDPLSVKPGEALPVRLLFRGSPAAGIAVIGARTRASDPAAIAPVGQTDAEGRISIPVAEPGKWRLHAIYMERLKDPAADWESYWATLTFEVR